MASIVDDKSSFDGNVAFKVTYVDSNWDGVCSKAQAQYNFANREWCAIQARFSDNCQSSKWQHADALIEETPCYDCRVLANFEYFSGMAHGPVREGEALKSRKAAVGKLALFTSRKPEDVEAQRFIFAVAPIVSIETDSVDGYDIFTCDPERAIVFREGLRPLFWRSYFNAGNPDAIKWNTGLFRYVSDKIATQVLQQVVERGKLPAKTINKAKAMLLLLQ
jgi:hypothetical protein